MTKFVPYPEQEMTIEAVLRDKAHLSASLGGFGKTLVGIEAVLRSGVKRTLIVCPLKVIRNWEKTLQRQAGESVKRISSTKDGRGNYLDLTEGLDGVYIVGWEFFRTLHWGKVKLDFIIADEIHRASNRTTKTWKMLNTAHAPYKLGLSATPAGNNIEGLWAIHKWLWPRTMNEGYMQWVTRMFHTAYDPFSPYVPAVVSERTPGKVWSELCSVTRFKPAPNQVIDHEIEVDLTPTQKKLYSEFEDDALTWLGEHPLVADLPAIKAMRLRQICLGVPSIEVDEEGMQHVVYADDCKSSKLDATFEILSDLWAAGPVPVMIYCHSRKFAEVVVKRLVGKGYSAVGFFGGQTQEQIEQKISGFGLTHQIIVATISAIGEGTDGLQEVCNTEIWLSLEDNRVLNRQCRWRLDRPGQRQPINRYLLRAVDTCETKQIGRIRRDDDLLDMSIDGEEAA